MSFASKATLAQRAGVAALLISQTFDVWPFCCQDKAAELSSSPSSTPLSIPILCLSKNDASLLDRVLTESLKSNTPVTGRITAKREDDDCSICMECMEVEQTVYRLPCQHVFHCTCLEQWLVAHNTCPLCRLAMPEQKAVKKAAERERRDDAADTFY